MKDTDWYQPTDDLLGEAVNINDIDFDDDIYEQHVERKELDKTEKRRRVEAKLEAKRINDELGYDISDSLDDY